jgi:beta-galactosidase
MSRQDFNIGWSYRTKVTPFQELGGAAGTPWTPVTLPHDALITTQRVDGIPGGETNGYYRGGAFEYRATLPLAEADRGKPVYLEFGGVYRDPVVSVNGALAGHHKYGYSRFVVRIDPQLRVGDNEVRVACRTHLDSRWYAGAGIYRDVHLHVKEPIHLDMDGVTVTTPDIDGDFAIVEVSARVRNASSVTTTARVRVDLADPHAISVGSGTAPVTLTPGETGTARVRMLVRDPRRWSAETPDLYTAEVELTVDGEVTDAETLTFGIRTIQVDARRGLRINGAPVKLRGACIHGDNGPLGIAAIGAAEHRKVELLKAAGFNAIRSSHHPASPALLDACDRIGMYVIDEAFDMWTQGKSDFDYSADFPDWWERDLEAMVAKDVNHASVIFYSIGNEIPETGSPDGGRWSRLLAQKVRDLDPTRLVTNGINGFVSVLDMVIAGMQARRQATEAADAAGGVNGLMNSFGQMMGQITASPMVTERTEESFAALDVAGMNYGEARYELDPTLFPDRVIVGTETWPDSIDRNWALVSAHPHLIGDFTWTGMDYLGEVGIGVPGYADDATARRSFATPYPGRTAFCGDLDLAGYRRPVSYYREIVFGLRTEPYIAVGRPERHGQTITIATPWSWTDTVSSWSWPGFEDRPVHVEVYADAEEVELLLDDASLGVSTVGAQRAFRADFEIVYRPGRLVAVARRDGREISRTALHTATGERALRLTADCDEVRATTTDLLFVDVELVDNDGILRPADDREVRVSITGDGVLAGFGSGAPISDEVFDTGMHRTFDGRALAIVRPTGAGSITVTAEAEGYPAAEMTVEVVGAVAERDDELAGAA